ncbi:MAG: NAD(P)-dependent oxidoreductase [Ilumatobacter sp.]|uniref:NAD-dependent epimerase/dehydratase family protein n=1 Tax=Ilumatobacter sp. TaxID=1967498 RepID=UPI00262BD527|nr:NAD(P)-dependent oxidoreductase [Ilumatobacter sp.]MDJ0770792.1 NAD(P)-dependent oxidoreductase [Ilumatobacter sp.]
MSLVLVTGSSGQVGRAVAASLETAGRSVRRFDLVDGDDLRDAAAVRAATRGCDAIVHAGAIAHDRAGTPDDIVATNVLGTWHVLSGAEQHGVGRIVVFSSAQVFGFAEGEGEPVSLPVDDDHPLLASRPYGMSKRLVEQMCDAWTTRTRITTIVLRPVMILDDEALGHVSEDQAELGAFVHLDDVAAAVELALAAGIEGHVRMTLCGPGRFDTARARRLLGWQPSRSWTR